MSVVLKDVYAPSVVTERAKPTHIGGDPKDKKRIVYCAGKGVFIRETQVLHLLSGFHCPRALSPRLRPIIIIFIMFHL